MIGNNQFFAKGKKGSLLKLLKTREGGKEELNLNPIIVASKTLSKNKTGALIILDIHSELKYYSASGEKIDAKISASLLENIFFKNSPLHDGGVIIENNRIVAARCILPVSENQSFPAHFGLRHRAAAGITETSRAIAIIISEETGKISLAKEGNVIYNIPLEDFNEKIKQEIN